MKETNDNLLQQIKELANQANKAELFLTSLEYQDKVNYLKSEVRNLKHELEELRNIKSDLPLISLWEMEKIMILNTLKAFNEDKEKTAKSLGITIKTLYNKLFEYGKLNV